jgi:hypothetical protein
MTLFPQPENEIDWLTAAEAAQHLKVKNRTLLLWEARQDACICTLRYQAKSLAVPALRLRHSPVVPSCVILAAIVIRALRRKER